ELHLHLHPLAWLEPGSLPLGLARSQTQARWTSPVRVRSGLCALRSEDMGVPHSCTASAIPPHRSSNMTDCDRCQQWEQICVPILDFLQAHPEVVGAKPGDSLTEKLLAF